MFKMEEMAPNGSRDSGSVILKPESASKKKRPNAAKKWCFTYFPNGTDRDREFEEMLGSNGSNYFYSEEICPTTKRLHWQGFVIFDRKIRPLEKHSMYKASWESMRGSVEENISYCTKEDGRQGTNIPRLKKQLSGLEGHELYPWQQKVLDILKEEPDRRTIHWIHDFRGCGGKTSLIRHICINHPNDTVMLINGKASDLKQLIFNHMKGNLKNTVRNILINLTRSVEDRVNYAVMEEIKDGLICHTKYEGGFVIIPWPHIIVMANFEPEETMMSADRWRVISI